MASNRSLVQRHRAAFPGPSFIAVDGTRMSDRDECRLWDMLWRIFRSRHHGVTRLMIGGYEILDGGLARIWAREALRALRPYYDREPEALRTPA